MRITSISFRANGPARGTPFSHVHVEATAQVDSKERPEDALEVLKNWVLAQVAEAQEGRRAIEELISLDEKIRRSETELNQLRALRGGKKSEMMGALYGARRPR